MGKPTPPPAPNPTTVANAQTASNEQTAQFNSQLNNYNTSSPYGSVNWSQDPSSHQWTQTTQLSPAEQAIFNQSTAAQGGALGIANQSIPRISTALDAGSPYANLPSLTYSAQGGPIQTSVAQTPIQTSFDPGQGATTAFDHGGQITSSFNPGQAVQGQVGPQNFGQAVHDAGQAAYNTETQYLNPQWQQAREQEESNLANQGLNPNSAAYQNAMQMFGNQENQAYQGALNAAVTAGNAEQNTLFGQQLQQGQFANQAAGQQYAQNQGQANFANQAQMQGYNENLGAAQFANQGAAQQYAQNQGQAAFANSGYGQQFQQGLQGGQFANTAQGQAFDQALNNAQLGNATQQTAGQENAYAQQLPINEFDALMSSGQVALPQAGQYTPSQAGMTDVTGAYGLATQAAEQNYQNQMQGYTSTLGGLFNLGSAAMKYSDRRLKTNIRRIGALANGVALYAYSYVWGGPEEVGIMADELARVRPDLVHVTPSGFLAVNYGGL